MANQPTKQIPFTPLSSGSQSGIPALVRDDRRDWFQSLTGQVFSNEILVPATGAWADIYLAPPAPLTEVLRLRLPRPEPLTLTLHPWENTVARYRKPMKLLAETSATSSLGNYQGRIFIEWGAGAARNWTYLDVGAGSLAIPSCSEVRVSAWSRQFPFILSASAQLGYPHSRLDATWTFMLQDTVLASDARFLPNFSRDFTANMYGTNLNDFGSIAIRGLAAAIYPVHIFYLRPPIPPNPQALPYPPVNVPIGSYSDRVLMSLTPADAFPKTVSFIANIRI